VAEKMSFETTARQLIIMVIIINIFNVGEIREIIARTTGVQTVVVNSNSNT